MSDLPETSCACATIVLHMYKKFQVNRTKIKGECQSETKAAYCYSCTDLTLVRALSRQSNIDFFPMSMEPIIKASRVLYDATQYSRCIIPTCMAWREDSRAYFGSISLLMVLFTD